MNWDAALSEVSRQNAAAVRLALHEGNRTLSGPEAIAATHSLRQIESQKQNWPYPWVYPPPGSTRVTAGADASGTILVPTVAAGVTQGLAYTVDEGYQFALVALVIEAFDNAGPIAVIPGQFTWSLDLNAPVGITNFQGSPIQGLTAVDVPLGSLVIPFRLERPEVFNPNDTIRSKFTNISLTPGAPNVLKTIFLGWKWPVS